MNGWIVLHRKLSDWEWYTDVPAKTLFIHCLLKANFEDKKWRGEVIKRGEFISSLGKLAEESGLTVSQVRTALSKLKKTSEILLDGTAFTRITICNYSIYQDKTDEDDTGLAQESHSNDTEIANQSQMNDTGIATTKQVNNINKENKLNNDNNKNKIKADSLKRAEESFSIFWKTTCFPKRSQDDKASMKKKYLNLVLKEKVKPDDILFSSNIFADENKGNEFAIGMRKFLQRETVEQYLKGDFKSGKTKSSYEKNIETVNEIFGNNVQEEILI